MAAVAGSTNEKEPVNIVHRNAIFCETIHKEQRHQKLYTHYGVNPYKKSKKRVPTVPMYFFLFVCTCSARDSRKTELST